MNERLSRTLVEFAHSFLLPGVEGLQPAGIYEVETVEEQLDSVSFVAYRRISTMITVRGPTVLSRQQAPIDPADLALALKRDAEASHGQP